MEDYKAIFKALEYLIAPWGCKSNWHEDGVDFSFKAPFYSEFLPNMGFLHGYCRYPGGKNPSELKDSTFLVQTGENVAAPSDWTPFTTLNIWAKIPKQKNSSLYLKWVKENPDMNEYFSLDVNDQMMSGTPYDPYTDRYLVRDTNQTVGKFRITDCDNKYKLITRPFIIKNSGINAEQLLECIESSFYKDARRLLLIQDLVATEEVLQKSFEKTGHAFVSYRP